MEGFSRKDEGYHQFLDLIQEKRGWVMIKREEEEEEETSSHGCSEEKKLELRLGPPTGDWKIHHKSVPSLGHFPNNSCLKNPVLIHQAESHFLHLQSGGSFTKESSQPRNNRGADNTNVANTSSAQKRTAPGPVVGWPPIRSFRKNLATGNSSKLASESQEVLPDKACDRKPVENCPKSRFVKVNMDGIPIGRKVDLKAYNSYEKLSYAVDELFSGLIAAQRDGIKDCGEGGTETGSLVNEKGEYTLVYEDNEGDRMLVGDVPWHMFVSTVKRLRVLRSSELPTLSQEKQKAQI